MAESEPVSFFSKLGSFCRYVDSHTAELKNEFTIPIGQKPHNYDRQLRALNKEVDDLKKLSGELRQKLAPISNCASYLLSTQELVTQQASDIDKIEKYLMSFGYSPLPKQEKNTANEDTTVKTSEPSLQIDGTSPARTVDMNNLRSKGTPILSNVGLLVVQRKDIPAIVTPEPAQAIIRNDLGTPTSTRIQNKRQEEEKAVYSLSALSHSSVTVDQFLARVEDNIELTPDVLPRWNKPMREREGQQLGQQERESYQMEITTPKQANFTVSETQRREVNCTTPVSHKDKIVTESGTGIPSTPSEPQLSEYTTSLFSFINAKAVQEPFTQNTKQRPNEAPGTSVRHMQTATPEEPGFSAYTAGVPNKERKAEKVYTPEEPMLSFTEKKLSHVKVNNKENCTPEEPILSYKKFKDESAHEIDERTPEEPFLSTAHGRHHPQSYNDDPLSPQLSDVTRSVLSISHNPFRSHYSHGQTEVYSHKASLATHKNEKPFSTSLARVNSNPSSLEGGIFARSMMATVNYPTYSEAASNQEESKQSGKVSWHRPGIPLEQFLQVDDDPASPQLSDITQRIIGGSKRW